MTGRRFELQDSTGQRPKRCLTRANLAVKYCACPEDVTTGVWRLCARLARVLGPFGVSRYYLYRIFLAGMI